MKPDWIQAPHWAHYLAMDSDGKYYWYSHLPLLDKFRGIWYVQFGYTYNKDCFTVIAGYVSYGTLDYTKTLEKRP